MGIPDQATTPHAFLDWLVHGPEQADIPTHEICPGYSKFNKPKDFNNNSPIAFRNSGTEGQDGCLHDDKNKTPILGPQSERDVEQREDLW